MRPPLIAICVLSGCFSCSSTHTGADDTGTCVDTSTTRAFDECASVVGDPVEAERVLSVAGDYDVGAWEELVVITDAESLGALWTASGLSSAGEPPVVDFASSQVVFFESNAVTCKNDRHIEKWSESREGAGLVASLVVDDECASCDTAGKPAVEVWVTPRATVLPCERGRHCGCR